jgi:hypothetical protein
MEGVLGIYIRAGKILAAFGLAGLVGIIFIVVLLIGPFLLIWSLNTLFNLNIEFTFWTWLAGFILILLFRGQHAVLRY